MSREHATQSRVAPGRDPQKRPQRSAAAPPAPGAAVLRLQATAGNQAVARMVDQQKEAISAEASVAGPRPAAVRATQAATPTSPQAPERSWWRDSFGGLAAAGKERLLGPLAGIARRVPGYGLLALALGRDPISGQALERGGGALLRALLELIPGGATVLANLEQSGGLQRAGAWLSGEVQRLGLTWEAVGGLFSRAFSALRVTDVFSPAAAWARLAGIFEPPLARVRGFAAAALGKLRELAFEGALAMGGGSTSKVMAVLRQGGAVIGSIFANPVGFAGNLLGAVRGGLGRFASNIGKHLQTGLFGWLFGALRGVIELPQRFDLAGVGSIVLQVLGLTWGRLRERLVGRLGGPRVAFLERSVDFVQRIAREGLPAVWSKILEFASGLTETVVGAIRDWVTNSIVGAAITRLVTMFNPVGAVIQAILSIYRSIQWLIQKADQLRGLATSIFNSIAAIASGSLGGAISAVENALARTLPVVISFLASQLGLSNIAEHVRGVVDRVRGMVERAVGRVGDFIATRFGRLRSNRADAAATELDERTPVQKQKALDEAINEAEEVLGNQKVTVQDVPERLAPIQARHKLVALRTVKDTETEGTATLRVEGTVNPKKSSSPKVVPKVLEGSIGRYGDRALDSMDLKELRRLAPREKAAAEALVRRYQGMSDFRLFERFANEDDETAAAIIRQRFPSNEAALLKVLGQKYRPPHSAIAILRRDGQTLPPQKINSGGIDRMTLEERALGFPASMNATHTEARAVKQISLRRGDFLEIRGQYDPCKECVKAMREAATQKGATIRYWWPGGSITFP